MGLNIALTFAKLPGRSEPLGGIPSVQRTDA